MILTCSAQRDDEKYDVFDELIIIINSLGQRVGDGLMGY
jgi:hypothetical protein